MKREIRTDERSMLPVEPEQKDAKEGAAKTRAERIREAQEKIIATYAETFRRLAE